MAVEAARRRLDGLGMSLTPLRRESAPNGNADWGLQAHRLGLSGAAPYKRPTFWPHKQFCHRANHCS